MDEASQWLMPVGKNDSMIHRYRQINRAFTDPPVAVLTGSKYDNLLCEHNRILYIGMVYGSKIRFEKLNMMTNEMSHICDLNSSYVGGILADDRYIYFTAGSINSDSKIYRFNLSTLTSESFSSSYNIQCYGQLEWFDDHRIIVCSVYGFMLFDTITTSFTYMNQSTSYTNRGSMVIGNRLIMSFYYSSSSTVIVYRKDLESFYTFDLPSSAVSTACYNNGKFYIVQSGKLYIYDEETETLLSTFVMPWNASPKYVSYVKGSIYVVQQNSNVLFVYDIDADKYRSILLPWTIGSYSQTSIQRPLVFKGYYFLPDATMLQVDHRSNAKYSLGFKYDQYTTMYNSDHINEFTYNDEFISFEDSYVTINDGDISKTPEAVVDMNHVYKISVNKNEYTKIKTLKFITDEN